MRKRAAGEYASRSLVPYTFSDGKLANSWLAFRRPRLGTTPLRCTEHRASASPVK
jgi:hypothetical protein